VKKKFPWLSMRKKTDPELPFEPPLWMDNLSNGEYFHVQTPYERKLRKLVLEKADANARRVGLDRRQFLASAMGMATTLVCIGAASGCSDDSSTGGTKKPLEGAPEGGGAICVPPEAMFDEDAACSVLAGDEFVFDVQTHWFNQADTTRFPKSVLDLFGVLFASTTEEAYVRNLFLESDTTMAVLTAWPGATCSDDPENHDPCGLPLSNESMIGSRDRINRLACGTERVIQHVQVLPNDLTGLDKQLEIMTSLHCEQLAYGWKLYPGFSAASIDPRGASGYFLTEDKPRRVIEHGLELGQKRFCVHKGLPIGTFFEKEHNHPRDVGVVARDYPEATFIIYHSGICSGYATTNEAPPEGPYDENEPDPKGVNALIRSLVDNDVRATTNNVYAEIGSAINQVQNDATASVHFFGKLMKYVGVDRVLWGTDCVIYGSPQPYLEWFRALTIPEEFQARYGYPPLDAANKAKILGLNAARIYGVDPAARRCEIDSCTTAQLKRFLDEEFGGRRWMFRRPGGPSTWREYAALSKARRSLGRPG
jgi:predicted TIM-barrel fold metal-dependent hydrolase